MKYYFLNNPEYHDEKAKVSNKNDYLAFKRKWFTKANYPEKNDATWEAEKIINKDFVIIENGREWRRFYLKQELHPDEFYEMFSIYYGKELEYLYPELIKEEKSRDNNWYQICPACQLYTYNLGAKKCPKCARNPIYKKEFVL